MNLEFVGHVVTIGDINRIVWASKLIKKITKLKDTKYVSVYLL